MRSLFSEKPTAQLRACSATWAITCGAFSLSGSKACRAVLDAAIRWAAHHGGWLLDRTYSGKGCSGLLGLAAEGRFGADVVFVHTGGWPALFAPDGVPR